MIFFQSPERPLKEQTVNNSFFEIETAAKTCLPFSLRGHKRVVSKDKALNTKQSPGERQRSYLKDLAEVLGGSSHKVGQIWQPLLMTR